MSFNAFWQPRSLKRLVMIAFILIITPLGFMLYKTSDVLEAQLQLSYLQTQNAIEMSQQGSILERSAEDIVRSANQYQIVQSDVLRDRLHEQIAAFKNLLAVQTFLAEKNSTLVKFTQVLDNVEQNPASEFIIELPLMSRELAELNVKEMGIRFSELQENAKMTRNALWIQTALLVLTTLILMLVLSTLISKPIAGLINRIIAIGRREPLPSTPLKGPSEIMQLDEQLQWLDKHLTELEAVKGQFIQHISHELKTPLTTIREGADLLEEQVPGPLNNRQTHVVSLIRNSSINLQSLIEQLLDYNQLQQSYTLRKDQVNIQKLIMSALSSLQLLITEKSLTLTVPESSPIIEVDQSMLQRVVNNLISNAVYYTDKSGQISIGTKTNKDNLIIDVSNSGTPIPEQDTQRIFEPFFQGSKRRTGSMKGTGIGLSIAKEAAHAMSGDLTLIENSKGCIVFRLRIPLEPV